jgi:hypothetical protein
MSHRMSLSIGNATHEPKTGATPQVAGAPSGPVRIPMKSSRLATTTSVFGSRLADIRGRCKPRDGSVTVTTRLSVTRTTILLSSAAGAPARNIDRDR